MRSAILGLFLTLPALSLAEVNSVEDCNEAIAADPETAREDAAIWFRRGGGIPARLCEAAALEAMGATATAARMLTAMAENPNRAMDAELRATVLTDGARLWLDAGRPDLTRAALVQAAKLAPPGRETLILRARAEAAEEDWAAALQTIDALIESQPDDARAHAFRAAALRRSGDVSAARGAADRAVELDPHLPHALFELGAAEAELGNAGKASESWFRLIELYPEHDLAAAAQRHLQRMN